MVFREFDDVDFDTEIGVGVDAVVGLTVKVVVEVVTVVVFIVVVVVVVVDNEIGGGVVDMSSPPFNDNDEEEVDILLLDADNGVDRVKSVESKRSGIGTNVTGVFGGGIATIST